MFWWGGQKGPNSRMNGVGEQPHSFEQPRQGSSGKGSFANAYVKTFDLHLFMSFTLAMNIESLLIQVAPSAQNYCGVPVWMTRRSSQAGEGNYWVSSHKDLDHRKQFGGQSLASAKNACLSRSGTWDSVLPTLSLDFVAREQQANLEFGLAENVVHCPCSAGARAGNVLGEV